jgi:hypothetical protein
MSYNCILRALPRLNGRYPDHACSNPVSHPSRPAARQPDVQRCFTMTAEALGRAACSSIEGFVRSALGCACPPDVFGDIRLEANPAGFAEIPNKRLLSIGGRLLVLLVDGSMTDITASQINTLLRRGRSLRDAGGFNRFRLVIVTPRGDAARTPAHHDGCIAGDDRLHLHTVVSAQLPALLRMPELP